MEDNLVIEYETDGVANMQDQTTGLWYKALKGGDYWWLYFGQEYMGKSIGIEHCRQAIVESGVPEFVGEGA